MAKLKKYDLEGNEVGEIDFDDQLLKAEVKPQLIKDYIVALLANRRQWSANTKGRSEIANSNIKPHPQKGTGKARQGTIKAPQYKGGGIVFGPKPKFNQRVQINRKEKRAVIRALLAKKIATGAVSFLQLADMEAPQTKKMAKLLTQIGIKGKKVLFLSDQKREAKKKRENIYLSLRNLPKVSFMPAANISGYDLMKHDQLLVTEEAVEQCNQILKGWQ
ncbi:MAG: 50S ribosomal protein L4 [Chlamydiota bacterium]